MRVGGQNLVMNKWEVVWNKKGNVTEVKNLNEFEMFRILKEANGFDVAVENKDGYFKAFYEGWLEFYDKLNGLGTNKVESVYEVGCGSGVNLFMFKNRAISSLGGCDYSKLMVDSARKTIGAIDIICCKADEIVVEPQYDLVMSESVFQYFDSLNYAEIVLRKMIEKSNLVTYVGEIHDACFEQELISLRRNTIDNYDQKYEGLNKLFFEKSWFEKIANEYGKKVEFTNVNNSDYINSRYLFNCYIL